MGSVGTVPIIHIWGRGAIETGKAFCDREIQRCGVFDKGKFQGEDDDDWNKG